MTSPTDVRPTSDVAALPTTRRRGRLTPGQERALKDLWAAYGVDPAVFEDGTFPVAAFRRSAPLVVEVGFGMGETTLAMAEADPDRDVLAVDLHRPGVGALLAGVEERGLTNVRVAVTDARDLLRDHVAPESLDEVRVYFPDPWPKARHHKRRLLQPSFVHLVATRLRVGGLLHVATDWTPYAEQVLEVVTAEPLLRNDHDGFAPRPGHRPVTRFESQGIAKGHAVHDLLVRRVARPPVSLPGQVLGS